MPGYSSRRLKILWGENYYAIDFNGALKGKENLKKVDFEEYNSNTDLMDRAKIKEMLLKGGFLK